MSWFLFLDMVHSLPMIILFLSAFAIRDDLADYVSETRSFLLRLQTCILYMTSSICYLLGLVLCLLLSSLHRCYKADMNSVIKWFLNLCFLFSNLLGL